VSAPNHRAALAALEAARPSIGRLRIDRHPDDIAADVIEAWSAVETALRSLLGGSSLSGLDLVRELSQRHQLSLAQANALAEFSAARDRATYTPYTPTVVDIDAAREGFRALADGLAASTGTAVAAEAPVPASVAAAPAAAPAAGTRVRGAGIGRILAIALVLVAVVGGVAYLLMNRGGSDALARGAEAYRAGRREAARGEFAKAVRDDPTRAAPHIYLARIARDEGDLAAARNELVQAIKLEPDNATAQREMGGLLFLLGNYEVARNFYVRAVRLAPDDRAAQGYLGCTLVRLGRAQEAARFLQRAGAGAWSSCAQQMAPGPPPGP
jgi:tetratricopeptide (TPR) repeat protein